MSKGSDSHDQLSVALAAKLQACGRTMRVARNTAVFESGSAPLAVYQVQRGLIRLSSTSSSGKEAVMGVLGPGQLIGETSLFASQPRMHDAWAVQDSELLVVPTADFRALIDEEPTHLRELLALISHRYRAAMQWIDRAMLLPFPIRLARRLLFEVSQRQPQSLSSHPHGTKGRAAAVLEVDLSQQSLADMLGASRQSVNKQFKQWERQGVVTLSYGRVQILKIDALAQLGSQGIAGGMDTLAQQATMHA